MKFLESITSFDNDVLIPINKIKFIYVTYTGTVWEIHIKHDDEKYEWIECFDDKKKLNNRYALIKKMLEEYKLK